MVYDELRQLAADTIAHEQPGETFQATALVHEAYVRLVNVKEIQRWDSKGHFFAAAAEAMRRILVERARSKHVYFAGLSLSDTAHALGISVTTSKRHWVYTRSWLHRKIQGH